MSNSCLLHFHLHSNSKHAPQNNIASFPHERKQEKSNFHRSFQFSMQSNKKRMKVTVAFDVSFLWKMPLTQHRNQAAQTYFTESNGDKLKTFLEKCDIGGWKIVGKMTESRKKVHKIVNCAIGTKPLTISTSHLSVLSL